MFECQYMSVDAGPDIACKALVAASFARELDAPQHSVIADDVRQLFECGTKCTPEAVAAAETKYIELKGRQPQRLAHRRCVCHGFQPATTISQSPTGGCRMLAGKARGSRRTARRILAELFFGANDGAFAHLHDFSEELTRVAAVKTDDGLLTAARFLGSVLACASRLQKDEVDPLRVANLRGMIVQGLGPKYEAAFADGERTVSDHVADKSNATIEDCLRRSRPTT